MPDGSTVVVSHGGPDVVERRMFFPRVNVFPSRKRETTCLELFPVIFPELLLQTSLDFTHV